MQSPPKPTLQSIYAARARIAPYVLRAPLVSVGHKLGIPSDFVLKCEFMQSTGAFKIRGAANRILTLSEEARARGVVTMSTGNHGRAVAAVATRLGVKATVCVSTLVPEYKRLMFERSGTDLRIVGNSQEETVAFAHELARTEGRTFVAPFDDPEVIAGQGTIGLELLEEIPDISCVVAGVGGGGLICGIALAMKSVNPAIRVIGVQMDRNPVMYHSLEAGRPIEMEEQPTLADSLAGTILSDNAYTFPMVRDLVDEIVLVSEGEIANAMVRVLRDAHFVLEGAAAAGVAGLLSGKIKLRSNEVVAVIGSGGNTSIESIVELMGVSAPRASRSRRASHTSR